MTITERARRIVAWLLVLAVGVNPLAAYAQTVTVTHFHNDIAGSPLAATDQAGSLVWQESYRPYGDRIQNPAAASTNKLWFHGKQVDDDSGLSYFGARSYDPVLGRFMGVDPQGFEEEALHSFNRYGYANNNPYKFRDPDGKWALPVVAGLLLWLGAEVLLPQAEVPANSGIVHPTTFPDGSGLLKGAAVLAAGAKVTAGSHSAKAIALGLDIPGGGFKALAEQTGASTYRNWAAAGITRRSVESSFGRAFHQAVERASAIHFSLDGIADVGAAVRAGAAGFKPGNFTNAELHHIANNRHLLDKTTFYRNGEVVPAPF